MKVITAASGDWQKWVAIWEEHLKKVGHDYTVFDLGGLDRKDKVLPAENDFEKKKGIVQCSFKPLAIYKALKENDRVLWVDADAFIQKPIELKWDFDVMVTKRRASEIAKYQGMPEVGIINAGVCAFRNSQKTIQFVIEWARRSATEIEQQVLNEMIRQDGLNIEYLPTEKYNNYYFDKTTKNAHIIHYKGASKKLLT